MNRFSIAAAALSLAGVFATPASAQTAAAGVAAAPFELGMASFFAAEMAGRRTANGETCDPATLTAAHRTLPFGTKLRVTNPANGKSVVVRINDRGPFARGRVIDLSKAAAAEIGLVQRGHGHVELHRLNSES
ncbi:septal ring lytic transglycosylase RlpA family protein [Sphingomonas sp. AX6]|uniref:septal ring lytic transglycosylase RlpA family protein n=1 Tax=Sphingomonas sp. AX6 TaxID=2653171 RepID=UPI0012F0140C|nr:septal ring lytic transglycosylase RlpA family protein [Sphingomonas sp. AX6]VXC53254.1 Endolytic peptidoglycan transglycosylase RlpA [Sphingomonas sp. AX6]